MTTTTTSPSQTIAIGLVTALSATWEAIRYRHPDVPPVVVTIGSGSIGAPTRTISLGHFATRRWQVGDDNVSELFVAGEGLNRDASDLLGTLLHEGAHGVADTRQIQDTSRQGRYHNQEFKRLGEELGLVITQAPGIGWSATALAPGTAERYDTELSALSNALVAFRRHEAEVLGLELGGRSRSATDNNLKPAACPCGRRIRVAASTLDDAPITCGACGGDFERPDD